MPLTSGGGGCGSGLDHRFSGLKYLLVLVGSMVGISSSFLLKKFRRSCEMTVLLEIAAALASESTSSTLDAGIGTDGIVEVGEGRSSILPGGRVVNDGFIFIRNI